MLSAKKFGIYFLFSFIFLGFLSNASADQRTYFPKNRSLGKRRIGLVKSVLESLQPIYNSRSNSNSRTARGLRALEAMKPIFSNNLKYAGRDFQGTTGNLGGYLYCSKTVTGMGLLAALGDNEATLIAKQALLLAVKPFSDLPSSITELQFTSDIARRNIVDTSQSNAVRIASFNRLLELGETPFISRSDKIYLETGEMSACIGIGYDWLYEYLSNSEKNLVEKALTELLLWSNNINNSFFGDQASVVQKESNWNAVMNGGSGLAALAALNNDTTFYCDSRVSLDYPTKRRYSNVDLLAKERICQAIVALRSYWKAYTLAGVYVEGPAYWVYGMESYTVFTDALRDMLYRNELWNGFGGIETLAAKHQKALFFGDGNFWNGNSDMMEGYGYSDSASDIRNSSYAYLSIAKQSGDSELRSFGISILEQQMSYAENLNDPKVPSGSLWASFASDWTRTFSFFLDPNNEEPNLPENSILTSITTDHRFDFASIDFETNSGTWRLRQKGGSALESHSQLDSSSFVLRINGKNWFSDLGHGAYPTGYSLLPNTQTYSLGMRFFQKNDLSHNLVTLGDTPMNFSGKAKLLPPPEEDIRPNYVKLKWITTSLYPPNVISSSRIMTFQNQNEKTYLEITDQLFFNDRPTPPSSGVIATWHALNCVPQETGWLGSATSTFVGNIPTVELKMKDPYSPEERLLLKVNSPAAVRPVVSLADPNQNLKIRKTLSREVEDVNAGCNLIEIPATIANLKPQSNGMYLLSFVVRIEKGE